MSWVNCVYELCPLMKKACNISTISKILIAIITILKTQGLCDLLQHW